ncbi:MAG: pyrroline-5-carboxylate reductase [Kiritimatiellia bacterium]|nr:pyrroline-5-carboxylate reductase [Lentisphaerota bacterium]
MNKRLVFIGAGNMAEALVRGLLSSAVSRASDLAVADVAAERRELMSQAYGVAAYADNADALNGAEVIVLAVKPQALAPVLAELRPCLKADQLVISIAAGVTLAVLERSLGGGIRLVRAMPNMPALVGAGATVYCRNAAARVKDAETARCLFEAVGMTLEMSEDCMDAVTALSGSGPAYVFYLAEAMARAGAELGLTRETAARLAAATVHGAGCLLRETGAAPQELRRRVTSKGGTTEAALRVFEERGLSDIVSDGLAAACRRAGELSG